MRRRFFVEEFAGERAVMSGEAAHHLGRVLRAEVGQVYELSDGERVRLGRVESVGRDCVEFSLLEEVAAHRPAVETTLLLAIVKFEAFEWALEKATELGVSRVVPLAAARSEKALIGAAGKRAARWRKILLEASQQSRRVSVPGLGGMVKPEEVFAGSGEGLRILLSERGDAAGLKGVLRSEMGEGGLAQPAVPLPKSIKLAIGPEGGWTDRELQAARTAGFREASLGKLILRTETAVIAALVALNYEAGVD
jgi:16S rRNA (uracil1498-N3)-methyltransferase